MYFRQSAWVLILIFLSGNAIFGQAVDWERLDIGLHLANISSPKKSDLGDSKITVLKINPQHYDFKLLCASEYGGKSRTVSKWAQDHQLLAAINAGMFQEDMLSSVGYMRNFDHLNNSHITKHNTFFAFNPVDTSSNAVQIIDRTCQDIDSMRTRYHSIFQNIRMISCEGENVWTQQNNRWSMSILAMDDADNVLFIFTRSPYSVHDFINILLELPLAITTAMYMEGGTKATLYISAEDVQMAKIGAFDNSIVDTTPSSAGWAIPNVLGIVKKR